MRVCGLLRLVKTSEARLFFPCSLIWKGTQPRQVLTKSHEVTLPTHGVWQADTESRPPALHFLCMICLTDAGSGS